MGVTYICPTCGRKIVHGERSTPVCTRCRSGPPPPLTDPLWVTSIRRLAKPEDQGVGDTVQRIASWLGGELFKRLSAKLGIPCGCTRRQAEWNARWPY